MTAIPIFNPSKAPSATDVSSAAGDAALVGAQDFWGLGNLSPLDQVFASTAIMKLVPNRKTSVAFIGRHLGHRLHRYAEETATSIDAFEAEPALSRLYQKKKSSVRLDKWQEGDALLKKSRYSSIIALQPSEIWDSVEAVYGQCVVGLKAGSRLFAADVVQASTGNTAATHHFSNVRSRPEHKDALVAAGFRIEEDIDLTSAVIAAIRTGFFESLKTLSKAQALPDPIRGQRLAAYGTQLRIWGSTYALMQQKVLVAAGFLAAKR